MADLGKTRIRRSDGLMLDERIVRTGHDTTHLSSSEKNTPTSPTGGINKDSDVIYSFPPVPGLKSKTLTFSYRLHPFKQDHAAVSYQYIDSTFTQRYTNHHGRPQERSVPTACSSLSLSLSLSPLLHPTTSFPPRRGDWPSHPTQKDDHSLFPCMLNVMMCSDHAVQEDRLVRGESQADGRPQSQGYVDNPASCRPLPSPLPLWSSWSTSKARAPHFP